MSNMLLGHGGKVSLVIKVAKNWTELCPCPSVLWKVKLASGERETWFLLTAHSKMQEMKLLNQNEAEHRDLKNSQPVHIRKNEKICLGENTPCVA